VGEIEGKKEVQLTAKGGKAGKGKALLRDSTGHDHAQLIHIGLEYAQGLNTRVFFTPAIGARIQGFAGNMGKGLRGRGHAIETYLLDQFQFFRFTARAFQKSVIVKIFFRVNGT